MISSFTAHAAAPQIVAQPQKRTVIEGGSYTFNVTATGTGPLAYQWRRNAANLSGKTTSSLALTAITTNDAGVYTVVITNVDGAITSAPAQLTVRLASDPVYPSPQGGWLYLFQGDAASGELETALDGTWDHSTDSWAGDGRGTAVPPEGGIETTNGILTIEDAVATGSGFNNRRLYLTHNLTNEPTVTNAATLLNEGVTLTFRARLTPPTDPLIEISNAPNGLINNSDGKGMFGIRQAGASGMIVGFSLNQASEDSSATTTFNFAQAGLHMNNLNGDVRASAVDPGEAGTINLVPLDPSLFHEFWITIQDNAGDPGTHRVSVYLDGGQTPTLFNVTAGVGSDGPATSYLALGLGSSGQRGAVDVDFFGYRPGVVVPSAFNQPVGFAFQPTNVFVATGQLASFSVGVTGTPPYSIQWYRGGGLISGATNPTYVTGPVVPADQGAQFTVVVTADSASITSSPPAILQLLALPVITGQPQSLSVTNGDPATFTVAATSPGTITYQWRFNGANLPGKTGSNLLLSSVAASDAGTYDVIVGNSSGSITSSPAVLSVVLFDFGDALGHPTLLSENGARHRLTGGLRLGASIDGEPDGQPSLVAAGDDSSGTDDEDGVIWLEPLRVGRTAALQVVASANGLLSGWFDFDRNGSWSGPGEQVYANVALVAGINSLSIPVPAGASLGNAYARFRFSTAGSVAFAGPAADGEVEDYAIAFVAVADLAVAVVDAPDPIAATSNLTYSITVSNAGPSSAASVSLTDSLPAGVAFVSALPSQGACVVDAGIVSCSLDTLPSGAVAGVTLIVTPAAATNLTNTVTVSNIDFDPVSANNAATVTTLVLNRPTITTQPQALTVTNGGSGTLSVVAAGTAPLAYQWLLGETVLPGQTSATLNLVNLQAAAAGAYRVRVTNSVGGVLSDPAIVTVLVGPAITAQPQSLTNLAGGSAAFSVIATGSGPLGYQWLFNGTNAIAGATTPDFTLPQTNPTDAGNYRVVITNLAGVVTSLVATLTVLSTDFGDAPPSYPTLLIDNGARHRLAPGVRLGAAADFEPDANTTPPALGDDLSGADDEDGVVFSTPLRTGQSASLSITASTNGVLNAWIDYGRDGSWAEPGDQILTNRNLTTGANSLAVLVPAGADGGLTYARFRFSTATGLSFTGEAANGEVEDYEVNLETVADVGVARVVAIDPVAVGGDEVYSITLTNLGPAQATGVALVDVLPPGLTFVSAVSSQGGCTFSAGTVDCAIGLLAPGASAVVTITGVPGAAGSMTNTATVAANETDLNAANNSVKTPVSVQAAPQILTEPQSLTLSNGGTATFSVTASGSGLRYQWRRDGLDLTGATNATLVIPNVQLSNAGLYTVRVNNQVGSVLSTEVSLTVLAALAFTSQPQNRTAVVGTTATFSVGVTGSGPVTYQWDRDSVVVPGATQPTLLLENVQTNQAGAYRVRVFNPLGSVTSLTATLTVLVPPSFTLQPESRTNFAGTTASFLAAAEGTLPLGYQWFFNQTNRLANQTSTTLTLTSVQTAQAGAYTLQASNVAGLATSAVAVLTVFEVDFGDAPEALGYPTSLTFNGARHRLLPGVRLGLAADAETNGLPNASATGDDTGGADDEDGVTILAPLVLGQLANVQVVASTNGFLNAWIDFNANGTWADPGDQVLVDAPLTAGNNTVQFPISPTAVTSTTFARFRFSTAPEVSYDGFADDGEVEDQAVTIQPGADLTALVSDNPDPVLVGGNVTYTIVVTNRGPSGATAVLLTNTLASSFTILTATSTQGSCNNVGGQIVCSLGTLANRGSATVTLTGRANAAGTLLCRAAVSANEGDGNPADNLVVHTTAAVTPAVAFSNPAALSVADASASGPGLASSYPSTLLVSGLTGAVYSVTVTLNSISHGFASDLDVLLLGPSGQSVVLMSDCGGNSVMSLVTLTFDDSAALSLPSGGAITPSTYRPSNYDLSEIFPFSAPPPPYGSTLSTFRGTNPNGTWSLYVMDDIPSDTGTISAGWRLNIVTVDPIADLAVTAAPLPNLVALGSNLVYTAAVTNRGPAAASAARLTNALPPGVTFVSANASQGSCAHQSGVVTCDLGNLAPAAGAVASITITPILTGRITNSISAGAAQLDFVSSNNTTRAITTVVPATDVLVAQTASANPVLPGQTLTYTLNVTNRGPNAATNVRLTDPLPPGVGFVSVSTTQGSCSNVAGTVFCTFGGLTVGASARATLAVTVVSTGSLTNTATVVSDEIDSAAANNVASLVVQAGVITDLAVGILNVPDPVPAGSPLTYTIRVTNLGPQTASSVQLTNPLPAGVAFVNATPSQGTCGNVGGVLDCALGPMANGAQATVLLTVTPSAVGGLINSAGVGTTLGAGGVDPVPANNLATTATSVLAPPAIATPPQSQTAITGSNVTMTVSATGSTPLSYQWLFNGTNLNGATSPSLALNNVTAASAGPYRVRVSNPVGVLTSVVATLTVLIPPVISDLTDRQTDEDTPTPVLAFTVGDADSAAAGLEVTALSSNTGLVPVANIVFGGSAGNRTVQITPARDQSGTSTITLRVRDTDNLIATDTFLLTVRAVNDPPTIVDVPNQASSEDAAAVITLSIGDVDHLADDLAVTATSSNPDLVPSANVTTAGTGAARTLTLRPSTNAFGSSTINITVTDTNGAAGGDTFVFTVSPVNDPPTLAPLDNLSLPRNAGLQTVGLSNITSGAANEIQALVITASSSAPAIVPHPTVVYTSPGLLGSIRFTPVAGVDALVIITVIVNDGGAANNTVTRSFNVAVSSTNSPPSLADVSDQLTLEDTSIDIPFVVSDPNTPLASLSVVATASDTNLAPATHVAVLGTGGTRTLRVQPATNQTGTTTLTLTVSDPLGAFAVESFLLTVLPVADPPSFGPLLDVVGNEDQTHGPIQIEVGSGEMDPALLTVTVTSLEPTLLPDVGLVLSGSGATRSLTITPAPDQFGTGAILLSVTDTNGLATDRSLVVTVNPVNDAPTLAPVTDVTVDEDSGPRAVALAGIGPGASNELQWLTFSAVSSNPSLVPNPTVSYVHPQTGASLLFTPISNAAGTATITITADDGQSANRSVSRSFTVTVRPLNDPPDLTSLLNVALAEDSTRVVPFVVADDTTPLDLLVLEISSSNPSLFPAGSMVLGGAGADRTLTLRPATNASGSATLTLSVRDTNNASSSRPFTVTVSAENDAPRIAGLGDRSVNEDSSGLAIPFTIEDPESSADTLTLSATSSLPILISTGGIVFGGSGTNRTVTVTPLPDQSGAATITVRVRDAGSRVTSASFVLTVNAVNDLPSLSGTPAQTIDEDTVLTLPLALSDKETALDSLSLVGAAADAVLVPNANITFSGTGATRALALTPAANRSGTTTVAVILSDGAGSVTNIFNLVVRSLNDPPTLNALSDLNLAVGAGLQTVNLAGIGTGAADEAQTLAISATSSNPGLIPNPAVSYTSANPTGTLTFTPAAGASGSATITVTVNDGQAQNNTFSRTFVATVGTAGNVPLFFEAESGTLVAPMLAGADATASAGQYVQSATANSGTVAFNLNITQAGDYVVWCRTFSPTASSDSFFAAVDGGTQDIYDTTLVPSSAYQWSLLNGRTTGTPRVLTFNQGVHTLTFQAREALTRLDSLYVTTDRNFAPGASNAPPTLDPIGNLVLSEDNGPRTVNLSGISDGSASETQTVTISAVSSNPALIPNPVVTYTSPNPTGSLAFTPVGNASGTATITVTANDGQALSNTVVRTFNVTINAVNDAPTLGAITDLTVNPGTAPQGISLTGIGSGAPNETQFLVVAASSSNPAVVPAPAVSYTSPASSGSLTVAPRPGTNGTAIITVTVNDGGPANPATSRTFTVTVRATPGIADIPDQTLDEDVVSGAIPFTIGDLETAAGSLALSATSSDTNLVASTNVVFGGSGANRTLTIRPSTNLFGNTTVTVTVTDGEGLTASDSFEVTVNSVNDTPTLSALPNRTLGEDSSPQTFPLAGIGSGASNEVQDLVVTATSSAPGLLPHPVVNYTSPGAGGTLTLGPVANATGTATVSVVVADGLSVNGSVTQQFLVTVVATNDPPVLSAIGPVTTREDTPVLVGFTVADLETPGAGLIFAASSSNPLLLPDANIVVGGAGANFALRLTPLPDRNGSGTISLTVTDESGGSSTNNFSFTVQPVNDAPLIGEMANLTISESTSTGVLPVVLTDVDSDVATVTVQAQSSNPTLLPLAGITLGGAGGSRTIVLTPATSQVGSSLVTLTATDTGGASSRRVFRLTVQRGGVPPVIITQPVGLTATNGATVVFTVGAQGAPPLSYQWRRNGLDLSGAISSTLTLVSVQASDAGSYTVVVRNSAGSVSSLAAELRVLAPPRITLLRRDGVTTEISFTSSAGLNHVVEYRDTVELGAWTSLPGVVGTGAVLAVTDPAAAGPARFYRVRVE